MTSFSRPLHHLKLGKYPTSLFIVRATIPCLPERNHILIGLHYLFFFFFKVKTLAIYSLSKFTLFNIVLTIVIMLYIRSLDLLILRNCNILPVDQCLSISPTPTSENYDYTLCFYIFDFFRSHIQVRYCCVFLYVSYLAQCPSSSSMLLLMAISSLKAK